ncbi:MAG: hypothetical protein FH753_13825 [Firmicutes bacterium]|nr:hypothetical protein [Bacillota bacterium]
MIVLIKTELLKLKRSYMFLMCIIGSICAPFLNWFVFINNENSEGIKTQFLDYMIQTNLFISMIIGILLYGLFTTYIFEREFTDNMYKHLFTVPISKSNLLISKIVVIMIALLILTITSYCFGIIFSLLGGFLNINMVNIMNSLIFYLKSYLIFIPLMIPIILVTLIFRGFVAPIAFSIIVEIILFIVCQSKYIALYPYSAPILLGTNIEKDFNILMIGNSSYNMISAVVIGILSFIACLIYLNKKEIV